MKKNYYLKLSSLLTMFVLFLSNNLFAQVPPNAQCVSSFNIFLDSLNGEYNLSPSSINNGSTGTNMPLTYSLSKTFFNCADTIVTSVTLTVKDALNNTSTCVSSLVVKDTVTPLAKCKNGIAYLDSNGVVDIDVDPVNGGCRDNCTFTYQLSAAHFTFANLGDTNITVTITDVSGNSSSCIAILTIADTLGPKLTCIDTLDTNLNNINLSSINIDSALVVLTASDSIGVSSITFNYNTIACAQVGTFDLITTATDNQGNTSTCTTVINLADSVPFLFDSVNDVNDTLFVYVDGTGSNTIDSADVFDSYSDNCGVNITYSTTVVNCKDTINNFKVTITDGTNTDSIIYKVLVAKDTIKPMTTTNNVTYYLAINGSVTVTDTNGLAQLSTDNCSNIFKYSVTDNLNFTCANLGANKVGLHTMDEEGNESVDTATITIIDTVIPIVYCNPINDTLYLNTNGDTAFQYSTVVDSVKSSCGLVDTSASISLFSCADTGLNVVTITVTASNGKTGTCNANVVVLDSTKVKFTIKDDGGLTRTIYADSNGVAIIDSANFFDTIFDNCSYTYSFSHTTLGCNDVNVTNFKLYVTDGANTDSVMYSSVIVKDTIKPYFEMRDTTLYLDATGNATLETTKLFDSIWDNCTDNLEFAAIDSNWNFNCSKVGVNDTSIVGYDTALLPNSFKAMFKVTVVDTSHPVLTCVANDTAYLDMTGSLTLPKDTFLTTATAMCGIKDTMLNIMTFTCSDTGLNNLITSVTGINDSVSTCVTNLLVLDTVKPVITCKGDTTIKLTVFGYVKINPSNFLATSSESCGTLTYSLFKDSLSCDLSYSSGGFKDTLYAKDQSGNIGYCTFNVTVLDTVIPTPYCKPVLNITLNDTGYAFIKATDVNQNSIDNCLVTKMTLDKDTLTCMNVPSYVVTMTVFDSAGNTATCTSTINISDTLAPKSYCYYDTTLYLNALGKITIDSNGFDSASMDNCLLVKVMADTNYNCADVGTPFSVTTTLTDGAGKTSTCQTIVTVLDTVKPTVNCVDTTIYLDASGMFAIDNSFVQDTLFDSCGILSAVLDISSFACIDTIGTNLVTLTVTDNNGNVSTCQSNVKVKDTLAPVMLVVSDTSVYLDTNGKVGFDSNDFDKGINDNCAIDSLWLSIDTLDCTINGSITVIKTYAVDKAGNIDSAVTNVTILDTVKPKAYCIYDTNLFLNSNGLLSLDSNAFDSSSSDNCQIKSIMLADTLLMCSDTSVVTLITTVTDISNNSATCITNVIIKDTIKPYVRCVDTVVYLDANGVFTFDTSYVQDSIYEACSVASAVIDINSLACADTVGTNIVAFTITDISGNTNSCISNIKVMDTLAPVMTVVSDTTVYVDTLGKVGFDSNDFIKTLTDNCDMDSLRLSIDTLDCTVNGTITVIKTYAVDKAGNIDSALTNVTILDTVKPKANCISDTILYLNTMGMLSVDSNIFDSMSNDNCAIDSIITKRSYNCADATVGALVTTTVYDKSGNIGTCQTLVSILDTVDPMITCKDTTIYIDINGRATLDSTFVTSSFSDNCGIVKFTYEEDTFDCADISDTILTITIADLSGNMVSCVSTVSIVDTIKPTAVCKDSVLHLDSLGMISIKADEVFDNLSSFDNCGIKNYTLDTFKFTCISINDTIIANLQINDLSNNIGGCVSKLIIKDSIKPNFTCSDTLRYNIDATGIVSLDTADLNITGLWDNCGIDSFYISQLIFTCDDIDTNNIEIIAYDSSKNIKTCIVPTIITDVTPPTAYCKDRTIYLDATGNASIVASMVNNNSTDNCEFDTMYLDKYDFSCIDVPFDSVELTVIDGVGLMSSCSARINLIDTIKPVAIAKDTIIYLDATGTASLDSNSLNNGSSDNCIIDSIDLSKKVFVCSDASNKDTVIMYVKDNNGNIITDTAYVTTFDTLKPVANCKTFDTVYLNLGVFTMDSNRFDMVSSDNCGVDSFALDIYTVNCSNIGDTQVITTVYDKSKNMATCITNVHVKDTNLPYLSCKDSIVSIPDSGILHVDYMVIIDSISGSCEFIVEFKDSVFNCANIGDTNISVTLKNGSGYTNTCTAKLTIVDNNAPVILVKDTTLYLTNANSTYTLDSNSLDNGTYDNCQLDSIDMDIKTFDCSKIGENTVTVTAKDTNGNISSSTAKVTVMDTTPPIAMCKAKDTVYLMISMARIDSNRLDNGSSDNCTIVSIMASDTSFNCMELGDNTITTTLKDGSGNTSTCTSVLTVMDTTTPTITCKDSSLYLTATASDTIDKMMLVNTFYSQCNYTITISDSVFVCSEIGINDVTLTITSLSSGKSSSCISKVTVIDTIKPTAIVKDTILYLNASGNAMLDSNSLVVSSDDNCTVDSIAISKDMFTCTDTGIMTVTTTVYDQSMNMNSYTSTVTVMDTTAPIAMCKTKDTVYLMNSMARIDSNRLDNGSSDNCTIVSIMASDTSFNCMELGDNTITTTLKDGSGNTSTCTSVLTVMDTTTPTITCKDSSLYLTATASDTIDKMMLVNTFYSQCNYTITISDSVFVCSEIGINDVTLTITSLSSGKSSSCISKVTVIDTIKPTAIVKDTILYLNASGNAMLDSNSLVVSSDDNCTVDSIAISKDMFTCTDTGIMTVTTTVYDQSMNMNSYTSTVTVMDTTAPIAMCKAKDTVYLMNSMARIDSNRLDNGSSDNCTIVSIMASDTSFNCMELGDNTITTTLKDGSGNTSTCTSVLTVMDTTTPTITCKDSSLYLTATSSDTIDKMMLVNTFYSQCNYTITISDSVFVCSEIGINDVTLTITSLSSGKSSSCISKVTVIDTIKPTAIVKDTILYLNANGNAMLDSNSLVVSSDDNCSVDSIAISKDMFTCTDTGIMTVTTTVYDQSMNMNSYTSTVTVMDTTAPMISCVSTINLILTNQNIVILDSIDYVSSISDNCDKYISNISKTSFSCVDLGSDTVTITAMDPSGNTSSCTTIVNILDTVIVVKELFDTSIAGNNVSLCLIAPVCITSNTTIMNPTSGTFVNDSNTCYTYTANNDYFGNDTVQVEICSNDGCDTVTIVYTSQQVNPIFIYDTVEESSTETYCANDLYNFGVDSIKPCGEGPNSTLTINANCVQLTTNSDVDATDTNCIIAYNDGETSTHYIITTIYNCDFVLEDSIEASSSTCDSTLVCIDVNRYEAIANVVMNGQSINFDGCNGDTITKYNFENGILDNGISTLGFTVKSWTTPFGVFNNNTVFYTIDDLLNWMNTVDPNGNWENDSLTFTGGDANYTLENYNYLKLKEEGTAQEEQVENKLLISNFEGFSILVEPNVNANLYVYNIFGCIDTVNIHANCPPQVTCYNHVLALPQDGDTSLTNNQFATVVDQNLANVTVSQNTFNCGNIGDTISVTVTATDSEGLTASCVSQVLVIDNLAPNANCQNITIQLDSTGNVTINSLDLDNNSVDNCGISSITADELAFNCNDLGNNNVEVVYVDFYGNTSSCDATVTVEDNIEPEFDNCPANEDVKLSEECKYIIKDYTTLVDYSDNCGGNVSITQTPIPSTEYTNIVNQDIIITLNATDQQGNIGVCSFKVNVTCDQNILITNFFSPNQNGGNETWTIRGISNYKNNKVQVYNRYGSLVYEKQGYNNEWDGVSNITDGISQALGKDKLPDGTYFYIIDLGLNDGSQPYTGYLELRR